MEGDGSGDGGNREYGVEEGSSTRLRGPCTQKSHSTLANNWMEKTVASTSDDAQVDASGALRPQNSDAMDASEVDSSVKWRTSSTNADADTVTEEVSAWRNPRINRRHPPMRWTRSARVPVTESSERTGLGRLADLFDSGARGSEASGSGDPGVVQEHSEVIGFSLDEEENAVVTGKKPINEVIDLGGDSPLPVNGLISDEEDGPSGQSPPRRLMQRPASADAKRARRIMHRSGVEERTVENQDGLIILEDPNEVEPSGGPYVAPPLPEPYNLRRGRSLNLGASRVNRLDRRSLTTNNGRLRRHRFQPGGSSAGVGLSDLNNLRRPFSVPSSSRNTDAQNNPVVNLEDQDSPTVVAVRPGDNTIVLEDDGELERARQLVEDERVARELQDSFALEDLGSEQPPTDEILARMLQAEENSHGRGLPIEQRPVFFAPAGMRSLLGGEEDEREARRLFRNELAQGHVSDNVASSSRIVRRGYGGRNSALGRTLNALSAPTPDIMNARRVQFPARMGLESRMEFLAALELALEQYPIGLQLAHVDRDFNENDYEMLLALDTDNHRHRGASLESISQLPVTIIAPTDVTDEDCSICLETPVAGNVIRRLPCMHAFHQQCIDQWLQHQAVCPVCKAHI